MWNKVETSRTGPAVPGWYECCIAIGLQDDPAYLVVLWWSGNEWLYRMKLSSLDGDVSAWRGPLDCRRDSGAGEGGER